MEKDPEAVQNPDLISTLSSCGPELRELMKQIDIMINQQRQKWEANMHALEMKLKGEEEDLLATKALINDRDMTIELLHKELEDVIKNRQELVGKYEGQLQKVREELNKLKRSYSKLQHKHLKETSGRDKEGELLKERHALAVEWEQQRSQYLKQLAILEADNKTLTDELHNVKSQMTSLPEEKEHMGCCLEVQHLRTELERAQESLRSRQLELESLQPVKALMNQEGQEWLEEREELRATLDSQDMLMRRTSLECQRLRSEAARLNHAIQDKDQAIRSLQDCLSAQGYAGVETFLQDLERTSAKLQCARASEVHLKAELACVKERLENVSRQRDDHSRAEQELRNLKAEYEASVDEMKKLREELQWAKRAHIGEVEGMRKEVSKLMNELQQRDLSIAAMSGSSSGAQLQLRGEAERAEQRTAELKISRVQLESLQTENQHLRNLLFRLQCCLTERGLSSHASLSSFARGTHHVRCQFDDQTGQEKCENTLSHATNDSLQPLHNRLQVDVPALKVGSRKHTSRLEEIQMIFKEQTCSQTASSSCSCSSASSSSVRLTRRSTVPTLSLSDSAAVGQSGSSEDTTVSRSPPSSEISRLVSPSPSTVAHFLEEETLRSNELLQRLDSHIQGMSESNVRTVSKFLGSST